MLIKWNLNKTVFARNSSRLAGNKFPLSSMTSLWRRSLILHSRFSSMVMRGACCWNGNGLQRKEVGAKNVIRVVNSKRKKTNRISYLEMNAVALVLVVMVLFNDVDDDNISGRGVCENTWNLSKLPRNFREINFSITYESNSGTSYDDSERGGGQWSCGGSGWVTNPSVIKIYIRWSVEQAIKHIKSHNKMDMSH